MNRILLLHQAGLIIYALDRADVFRRNPCILSENTKAVSFQQATSAVKMKISDVSGAFMILGLGVGLASASFVVELVVGRPCKKKSSIEQTKTDE